MNVFITGGTSGIGLSLATFYLNSGHRVGICGRNITKVNLPEGSKQAFIYKVDVYNKQDLETAIFSFTENNQLDLLIASAGYYYDELANKPLYNECTDMLKVNIVGAINAFEIARERMRENKQGHMVSIASVSGLLDYPNASIYSKSKRANIQICDAYRQALTPFGITVTAIMPGYVDTPKLRSINNNDLSKKMFLVSCDHATEIITSAIENKKNTVVFPRKMKFLMYLLASLPKHLLMLIMGKHKHHTCKK